MIQNYLNASSYKSLASQKMPPRVLASDKMPCHALASKKVPWPQKKCLGLSCLHLRKKPRLALASGQMAQPCLGLSVHKMKGLCLRKNASVWPQRSKTEMPWPHLEALNQMPWPRLGLKKSVLTTILALWLLLLYCHTPFSCKTPNYCRCLTF